MGDERTHTVYANNLAALQVLRKASLSVVQNGCAKNCHEGSSRATSKCGAPTKAVLKKKVDFESLSCRSNPLETNQNLVLIQFSTVVAGVPISDCFLWPRHCRSGLEIKIFAVNLLSDRFGASFGAFDSREVECKFSFITCSFRN